MSSLYPFEITRRQAFRYRRACVTRHATPELHAHSGPTPPSFPGRRKGDPLRGLSCFAPSLGKPSLGPVRLPSLSRARPAVPAAFRPLSAASASLRRSIPTTLRLAGTPTSCPRRSAAFPSRPRPPRLQQAHHLHSLPLHPAGRRAYHPCQATRETVPLATRKLTPWLVDRGPRGLACTVRGAKTHAIGRAAAFQGLRADGVQPQAIDLHLAGPRNRQPRWPATGTTLPAAPAHCPRRSCSGDR